jgi:GNAT superfamily N-acetyltransferase
VSEPARAQPSGGEGEWRVRRGRGADAAPVAEAARELLLELGARTAPARAMRATAQELLDSPWAGAVIVAERVGGGLVGMLGASWQLAIHLPGRYALVQELWVDPAWRGRAIGGAMLAELVELARARRIEVVEVGLPRPSFAGLAATEAFYRANGFLALGPRMRLMLR